MRNCHSRPGERWAEDPMYAHMHTHIPQVHKEQRSKALFNAKEERQCTEEVPSKSKKKKKITQAYDHEGVQCWFKPGFKGKTMQETSKAMRRDS